MNGRNIQPVISGACCSLATKLSPRFYPFAAIAIASGILLSVDYPHSFESHSQKQGSTAWDGVTPSSALFWGSTVAGRGLRAECQLARVADCDWTSATTIRSYGENCADNPSGQRRRDHPLTLLALWSYSLWSRRSDPAFDYFQGLRLTRASTAVISDDAETLAAVCIT